MKRRIEKAAVLGAGTMGSRIAAHLANAGLPCILLDIVPPDLKSDAPAAERPDVLVDVRLVPGEQRDEQLHVFYCVVDFVEFYCFFD